MTMGWAHGVSKIVSINRDKVTVRCPFCDETHAHSRQSIGSREVVAGCHVGGARSRSYSIPEKRR